MKIIIKNCDCYGLGDACLSNNANQLYCKDITDCVLKRIVELCNNVLQQETDPLNSFEMSFAQKILQLLEIEEVDE